MFNHKKDNQLLNWEVSKNLFDYNNNVRFFIKKNQTIPFIMESFCNDFSEKQMIFIRNFNPIKLNEYDLIEGINFIHDQDNLYYYNKITKVFLKLPIDIQSLNINQLNKNKNIKSKLLSTEEYDHIINAATGATTEQHKFNLDEMCKQIKNGEIEKFPVFDDINCLHYLIFLLEKKDITLHEFLMVYMITLAKMQYTENGQKWLKKEDIKKQSYYEELSLISAHEIKTEIIQKIKATFYKTHPFLKFDEEKFSREFDQLSGLDSKVIKIENLNNIYASKNRNESFMNGAIHDSPLSLKNNDFYYIYSPGLIDFILKQLNEEYPIKMAPILGTVGEHSLFKLGLNHLRPINLYISTISSNPKKVHNASPSGFSILIHDLVYHLYVSNFMNKKDCELVYNVLIPAKAIVNECNELDDISLTHSKLIDFSLHELAGKVGYINEALPVNNINQYIFGCFKTAIWGDGFNNIGDFDYNLHSEYAEKMINQICIENDKQEHKFDLETIFSNDYFKKFDNTVTGGVEEYYKSCCKNKISFNNFKYN